MNHGKRALVEALQSRLCLTRCDRSPRQSLHNALPGEHVLFGILKGEHHPSIYIPVFDASLNRRHCAVHVCDDRREADVINEAPSITLGAQEGATQTLETAVLKKINTVIQ